MRRIGTAASYAIAAVVVVGILLAGAFGLGWFGVEAERTIVQNSRQYIITQQQHLVDLAADCAELDSKIAETDDQTLIDTYTRQQDSIDRQMERTIAVLDANDVPIEARGGC